MILLSSLWNSISGPSKVEEAIIDAICAVVLFDDELTDGESNYTIGFVEEMMGIDRAHAVQFVDAGLARVRGKNIKEVLKTIAERLPEKEQRHVAVLAVIGASRIDSGFHSWGEADFLHTMAETLGLSQAEFQKLEERAEEELQK